MPVGESYIAFVVHQFDSDHGVPELAEVVMSLFHASLQPSSQRTYRTGQRAYSRFLNTIRGGDRFPFNHRTLSTTELNLAFFMAFLILEPSITKASTILGYETHVKYLFKTEGCPEKL